MSQGLMLFESEEFGGVRVIEKDGDPWFVALDICSVLEISNSRQATSYLDDDEKGVITNDTPGGSQKMTIISESGLYSLVLRSRKPEAKRFRKWVTSDVIPSIRKNGAYMTPEKLHEVMSDPRNLAQLLNTLADEQDKNKVLSETVMRQSEKIALDAPKVSRTDSVIESGVDISMGTMANILKQNGYDIGSKRLFAFLRGNGYLVKQKGKRYNLPTQKAMALGLFVVSETEYDKSDGSKGYNYTTRVTGRGQVYLIDKLRHKLE